MNTTKAAAAGQITAEAAEIYEEKFVPALFGQFAAPLLAKADVGRADSIIDVATGTGIVARAALDRGAAVTAVDINEGMRAVAQRLAPGAEFVTAAAEALPFADDRFDVAICQFGLMFFSDKAKAIAEMARVVRPGGRIAIAVFDRWEKSPGYCDLIPLIGEVIGNEAAEALKAPFCLGDTGILEKTLKDGGLGDFCITEYSGTVRQPSIAQWLDTEIGGWTLATMVDGRQMEKLKHNAHERLAKYVSNDGQVRFPAPAYFISARV